MRLPVLPARLAQIDLLKALAIIAVIGLHSLTADQANELAVRWWIGQAVPVFAVLMGLNATASLWRRAGDGPRAVYTRSYVLSRIDSSAAQRASCCTSRSGASRASRRVWPPRPDTRPTRSTLTR